MCVGAHVIMQGNGTVYSCSFNVDLANAHCRTWQGCALWCNPPKLKVTALSLFLPPPLPSFEILPLPPFCRPTMVMHHQWHLPPSPLPQRPNSSVSLGLEVAGIIGHIWDLCGRVSGSIPMLWSGKWGRPVVPYLWTRHIYANRFFWSGRCISFSPGL